MESLTALKNGEKAIVMEVTGGRGFVSRASDMGFTADVELTMLRNFTWGPVLVSLRDSQIARGRGEAEKRKVRRKEYDLVDYFNTSARASGLKGFVRIAREYR